MLAVREAIPKARDLAIAEFATLRLRLKPQRRPRAWPGDCRCFLGEHSPHACMFDADAETGVRKRQAVI
jgi:hypothetical protein